MEDCLRVHTIDQVLIALEVLLDAEEDLEPDLVAGFLGFLVPFHVGLHILRPGQVPVRACIAMEEMVGDEDAVIAACMEDRRVFATGRLPAFAGFDGVQVGLVSVHVLCSFTTVVS